MPFAVEIFFHAAEIVFRLLLSVLLGGLIGYEREHTNRPAGFRTHILVCVGSALVMITSEFIYTKYGGGIDPARLGAQVVSGIGFLGAGTIIRDGVNVRGLTTAASLWAVSCVGIAAGAGFYGGAVIATGFIFLTLIILKKAELKFTVNRKYKVLVIESENVPGRIGAVTDLLEKHKIIIKNIQLFKGKDSNMVIKLAVKLPGTSFDAKIVDDINSLEGVLKVYEE